MSDRGNVKKAGSDRFSFGETLFNKRLITVFNDRPLNLKSRFKHFGLLLPVGRGWVLASG